MRLPQKGRGANGMRPAPEKTFAAASFYGRIFRNLIVARILRQKLRIPEAMAES
jgi:hypothetical protein